MRYWFHSSIKLVFSFPSYGQFEIFSTTVVPIRRGISGGSDLKYFYMLPPPLLRAPTLPPQLPFSPPLSSPSHLLLSPARPAPLPHIILPPFPPTLFLPILPLPPIALPAFLLSLILSTPSFSAYVLLARVRSSSTWAFNVCLCVCFSSPFLDPWGAST